MPISTEAPYQRVVLTGEMRSGTTFLANLLNRQRGMTMLADVPVSLFFQAHQLGIKDIDAALGPREKRVLLNNLWQEGRYRRISFDSIGAESVSTWYEIFIRALELIREQDDQLVGIKRTRERDFVAPLLSKGVKVIYIVRDPRDVLLSARDRFGEYDLFLFAESWRESVGLVESWKHLPGFFWLRFEDLVLRRNGVIEALGRFLGIEVRPDAAPQRSPRDLEGGSSFGDISQPFDPAAVARWRTKIASEEVQFASVFLEEEIARLGYPGLEPSERDVPSRLLRQHRKRRLVQRLKDVARPFLS